MASVDTQVTNGTPPVAPGFQCQPQGRSAAKGVDGVPKMKKRSKKGKAWEQLPEESIKAFTAAKEYFDLGPSRSLEKVADKLQKSLGLMKGWSGRYRWRLRAAAYSRSCDQIQQEVVENQLRQTAQKWADREEQRREDDHQIALQLRAKALEILKLPVATVTMTSADGKSTTIVKPGHWNLATAARLAESASDLSGRAIRNDGACQNVVEEVDDWKLVPYKSLRGKRGVKNP
jgi:hypothetical protein